MILVVITDAILERRMKGNERKMRGRLREVVVKGG